MDRMNKEELIKLIDSLEMNKNDFIVLSSGALVLRGIMDSAGDLDISVTSDGLDYLKSKYSLKQKENGFYQVNDKIECVEDNNKNKELVILPAFDINKNFFEKQRSFLDRIRVIYCPTPMGRFLGKEDVYHDRFF